MQQTIARWGTEPQPIANKNYGQQMRGMAPGVIDYNRSVSPSEQLRAGQPNRFLDTPGTNTPWRPNVEYQGIRNTDTVGSAPKAPAAAVRSGIKAKRPALATTSSAMTTAGEQVTMPKTPTQFDDSILGPASTPFAGLPEQPKPASPPSSDTWYDTTYGVDRAAQTAAPPVMAGPLAKPSGAIDTRRMSYQPSPFARQKKNVARFSAPMPAAAAQPVVATRAPGSLTLGDIHRQILNRKL